MSHLRLVPVEKAVASRELEDAWTDFLLSREAMLVSVNTLRTYNYTAGRFVAWITAESIHSPCQMKAKHVREFLASLAKRGLTDSYIHCNARAIKTFTRFIHSESYIEEPIRFQMPSMARKQLPVLSPSELRGVLQACETKRDKALVLLLVDSGLRRAEACSLNWEDIDIKSGLVRVRHGKGGKSRSVVVGVATRRALLCYRRTVSHEDEDAVLQTQSGKRLTHNGLRSALLRISKRAGVHVAPHTLRRTFATLSLRAGMNPLHLQGLLGHSSLEMVRRYVQMLDEDLLEAHKAYGPIDRWISAIVK